MLRRDESACASTEKTEEMCKNCVRNIDLYQVEFHTIFTEFKITKKFVGNKITKKCDGFWEK